MGSPSIDLDPETVSFNMAPDEFSVQNISLTNNGDDATLLMFDILIADLPFQNPSGSPDAGGYYWTSSENEPTMDFNWIDIQGIGSQIQFPTNDAAGSPVSIGFNFPFYVDHVSLFRIL